MLLIAVTLLGGLIVSVGTREAHAAGTLGLNKAYGPGIGSAQPYEPVGPWIDGILVPQFLSNQDNEWSALKAGAIDIYDWPLRASQINEYSVLNPCVTAPDAPAGIAPCPAGQAPIQHEITLVPVQAFGKFEIDLQNAAFPTNQLAFRQAVAFATDKEAFITNTLNGLAAPNYAAVGCPALCGAGADGVFNTADDLWVKPSLNENGLTCVSRAGTPMPFTAGGLCNTAGGLAPARATVANALLDSLGFASRDGLGLRLDNGAGCASRTVPNGAGSLITINNCGKELQPVFYVRLDDPSRTALGRQLQTALQNNLGIDMDIGGATKYTGDFQNYIEVPRRQLFVPVFFNFAFNLYTGGWFLNPDPTYINDLYNSKFIRAGLTNYPNYNDAIFDNFASGLRAAAAGPPSDFFANARSLAFAAENEFNATLPIVDVWTDTAPLAYRNYHVDTDTTLNGLKWEGIQNQVGVGPFTAWSWFNAHLIGAPLHDPSHPVFIKWGWKTDVLDSPNPVDSSFVWDAFAYGLTYDTLNVRVADDSGFSGDSPWASSLPTVSSVAPGGTFPNGEVCTPDPPAGTCATLSYQLRSDLTFARSVDGTIAAVPLTANDIRFSILVSQFSPTSFLTPGYVHVQDVVVKSPTSFDVYERNNAVWNRHDIAFTVPLSVQHWCQEAHDSWPGTTLANCLATPTSGGFGGLGWPDAGVNVLSSTNGHQVPGPAVGVDLGSYAFTYDSQASFPGSSPNGPVLYRTRQGTDGYFTTDLGANSAGIHLGGWHKFHLAGNVNWYCTSCSAGIASETGPLPAPDMAINIVDLAIVAVHFGQTPGLVGFPYGNAAWDLSGSSGTPDGTVNIFDLTRVALHFGQSYLGGTDIGGGAPGTLPTWIGESIPGS